MRRILIIDKDTNKRKEAQHFINILFPRSLIYQVPDILYVFDIPEKEKIDFFFLNTDFLQDKNLDRIIAKYKKPIILLSNKDKRVQEITFNWDRPEVIGELFVPTEKYSQLSWIQEFINEQNKQQSHTQTVILSTTLGLYPVNTNSIIAIEKADRGLIVYTQKQIIKDVRSSLTEMLKHCGNNFVYINRQCAININAITRLLPTTREVFITVDEQEVSFTGSRNKWKSLVALFNDGEVCEKEQR